MPLDYEKARDLLEELFNRAEDSHRSNTRVSAPAEIIASADQLFASPTQSYREVLLGCGLARLLDPTVNIRCPYMGQGSDAFNGRTLDEKVVNPFLQERLVPSSKGPYLAVFRRSVDLTDQTAGGLRDKTGYAAMLTYLDALESAKPKAARDLVTYLLVQFVKLRDASNIPLAKIGRLSLEQLKILCDLLLAVPSGGLMPVLLTVAILQALKSRFELKWTIEWQGINVADKASGAGGDVTVTDEHGLAMAIEVTERQVDKARVVSTFNTKIIRAGLEDYLFLFTTPEPTAEAREAAQIYFGQGHEINFLSIRDWLIAVLAAAGVKGRRSFLDAIVELLGSKEVPSALKLAWNDAIRVLVHT